MDDNLCQIIFVSLHYQFISFILCFKSACSQIGVIEIPGPSKKDIDGYRLLLFILRIIMLKLNCAFIILFQIKMSGVPNLKYKTSLCNAWKEGKFHIIKVSTASKPNFVSSLTAKMSSEPWNKNFLAQHSPHLLPQGSYKFKTTYCKFYSKGDCKLGQSCSFAHNKSEKRQKSYVPKQQTYGDPTIYYYPQYYPSYPEQYTSQLPDMYQFYPHNAQTQTSATSPESRKSQQRQEKGERNQAKISQTKVESPQKDSQSM